MQLKVGDIYKCPEGHVAKIVWISEDKKVIAVRCSREHVSKVVKVVDYTKRPLKRRNYPKNERKIYAHEIFYPSIDTH